jgi:hypothetical protein
MQEQQEQNVKITDIGCFPILMILMVIFCLGGYIACFSTFLMVEIKRTVEKNTEVLEKVIDAIEAK